VGRSVSASCGPLCRLKRSCLLLRKTGPVRGVFSRFESIEERVDCMSSEWCSR